jgi:hypothetical protein
MAQLQDTANKITAALDKITQAGGNQQQVQQAVQEAKQLVQQLVQEVGQSQGGQHQGAGGQAQR